MNRNNHLLNNISDYKSRETSMLIRHAPRHSIPPGTIYHHDITLTSSGRMMAYEFGKELPNDIPVRLFYSPIARCKETAECISKGVISNGGTAVLVGERDFLDTHAIVNLNKMVGMMEKIGGLEFIQKWLDGEIERTVMKDPHQVVVKILEGIVSSKKDKKYNYNTLDIHVTHDLNIISVREILLGARLEETGWANYLDGIVFIHFPNSIIVAWESVTRTINI